LTTTGLTQKTKSWSRGTSMAAVTHHRLKTTTGTEWYRFSMSLIIPQPLKLPYAFVRLSLLLRKIDQLHLEQLLHLPRLWHTWCISCIQQIKYMTCEMSRQPPLQAPTRLLGCEHIYSQRSDLLQAIRSWWNSYCKLKSALSSMYVFVFVQDFLGCPPPSPPHPFHSQWREYLDDFYRFWYHINYLNHVSVLFPCISCCFHARTVFYFLWLPTSRPLTPS
jgi:hypothetical protein